MILLLQFSITSFCAAISKTIAVLLNKFISPTKILVPSLIVNNIMAFMLSAIVNMHPSIIWICTILASVMAALQVTTTLGWAGTVLPVSGKVASILSIPFSISLVTSTVLIGYLMDALGPMMYAYSLATFVVIANILFVLTWYSVKIMKREENEKQSKQNEINLDLL